MKFEKYVRRIPVALAMHASQSSSHVDLGSEGSMSEVATLAHSVQNSDAAGDIAVFGPDVVQPKDEVIQITFPADIDRWEKDDLARFDELVEKEAFNTLTYDEFQELESL